MVSPPKTAVLFGTGPLARWCAEEWLKQGHELLAIGSEDSGLLAWAEGQKIRSTSRVEQWQDLAETHAPDFIWNVAQLRLLNEAILRQAKVAAVNFHDGPLPAYAGLNAPHWALLQGEGVHGISWHEMRAEDGAPSFDAGVIYASESIAVDANDSAWSLHAKCFEAGQRGFRRLLVALGEGREWEAVPQDLTRRSVFKGAERPDGGGFLSWSLSTHELERNVRAMDCGSMRNPFLTARIAAPKACLLVGQAQAEESRFAAEPGTLMEIQGDSWLVACSQGALRLSALRKVDGVPVDATAAAQLCGVAVGERLPLLTQADQKRLRSEAEEAARAEMRRERPIRTAAVAEVDGFDLAVENLASLPAGSWVGIRLGGWAESFPSALLPVVPLRTPGAQDPEGLQSQLRDALCGGRLALDHQARFPAGKEAWPTDERGMPLMDAVLSIESSGKPRLERREASPQELRRGNLPDWATKANATQVDIPLGTVVDEFLAQVERTPDAVAFRCQGVPTNFEELDARSAAFAHHLIELGVQAGDHIGLYLERSPELLIAMMGTLRAGAAYVPLDPEFPAERLQFIAQDAALAVCVTQRSLERSAPSCGAPLLIVDTLRSAAGGDHASLMERREAQGASDVAYVLYTSGSTGKPKGVEVEHGNLTNFFVAMDRELGKPPGPFLAVSSVSFDISFLELWWTLCRGTEVVLYLGEDDPGVPEDQRESGLGFGLFFWGAQGVGEELKEGESPYDFLLDAVRFADGAGFEAAWTPERHFHAFGGLFPNPQVTSAALAVATQSIQVRSGSTVGPLHSPVRLAEDWAVIDQLSKGRAGIALASGWAPNDFVLLPDHYEDRKERTFALVDQLRRLWRGEAITQRNGVGEEVEVRTQPQPVQQPIPIWITAASSPETFERAGRLGCHVLTHLLGQSLEEVRDKVALYRNAWREAGHEGKGKVSLMLHTFVGEDDEHAREIAREPMKAYLRTAVGLVEQAAWAWPATKQELTGSQESFSMEQLSAEDQDALLDFAFERYFETSGLFGGVERCVAFAQEVVKADVDEVACLVDYGVSQSTMMASLPRLAEVRAAMAIAPSTGAGSILGHLQGSGIRAMQCTPSMAQMMLLDESTRASMAKLELMLVGGEALPLPLAQQLEECVGGRVVNMYGPTETTIWSTCHPVTGLTGRVPIGRPIANTQVYLLDEQGEPVAPGEVGELWIGGRGVTRGYWNRPQLTADRFRLDPWSSDEEARMYATGDRCSWHADGYLCFHGRADAQVKLRGYRIELGEIEHALVTIPGVAQAVALVREDVPGDQRLVAYYTANGEHLETETLREALKTRLPGYMIPQWFVALEAFPQTPNGKIDRLALPAPQQASVASKKAAVPTAQKSHSIDPKVVREIQDLWCSLLGVNEVGTDQNFFEVGGHSLLAVRVQIELKQRFQQEVSLVDVFRLPTIEGLASLVHRDASEESGAEQPEQRRASARGAARRRALRARAGLRPDQDRT